MARYERPLTEAERRELQRIRHNRAVRNARNEIRDANYFSGTGKAIFAIVAIFFGGGWPLLVWRKPGTSDPDATGWVVFAVWMAVVATLALLLLSADEKARSKTPAQRAQQRIEKQQEVSELRAQVLAGNGVALSDIADPAMRDRVAEIRAAKTP
jgi:hypothetical protein